MPINAKSRNNASPPSTRIILNRMQVAPGETGVARINIDPTQTGHGSLARVREQSLEARVRILNAMGLSQPAGIHTWDVRQDFDSVLRAMQRAADHQKTLTDHGSLLSDQRLQLSAPKWREINSLQGRILSHGEGENGNRFLLLEGTEGRVYHLGYTPELDEARARGDLRVNSIVVFTKTVDENRKRRIQSSIWVTRKASWTIDSIFNPLPSGLCVEASLPSKRSAGTVGLANTRRNFGKRCTTVMGKRALGVE